jgi:uncharacterized protein (DUF952 family)
VTVTYHLTPRERWDAHRGQDEYTPEAFSSEGFIHCTDGMDNVVAVGNRYYTDDPRDMVCLVIDPAVVLSEIRYEDPAQIFPHIYGPLNVDAVVEVRSVVREPNGSFAAIGDPVQR